MTTKLTCLLECADEDLYVYSYSIGLELGGWSEEFEVLYSVDVGCICGGCEKDKWSRTQLLRKSNSKAWGWKKNGCVHHGVHNYRAGDKHRTWVLGGGADLLQWGLVPPNGSEVDVAVDVLSIVPTQTPSLYFPGGGDEIHGVCCRGTRNISAGIWLGFVKCGKSDKFWGDAKEAELPTVGWSSQVDRTLESSGLESKFRVYSVKSVLSFSRGASVELIIAYTQQSDGVVVVIGGYYDAGGKHAVWIEPDLEIGELGKDWRGLGAGFGVEMLWPCCEFSRVNYAVASGWWSSHVSYRGACGAFGHRAATSLVAVDVEEWPREIQV
ncbi:hypothetical protein BDN72DRAFT_861953 [Pluteus cervinus]|uniref:Uncharacterized protein n=1 Tax=Pluteus cervinus TaxID=181527 RepID=A0ACD3AFN2_9AGAR|nr:hypothetical protein BDN72DRAFT_861953 [Pluteus cervinus]